MIIYDRDNESHKKALADLLHSIRPKWTIEARYQFGKYKAASIAMNGMPFKGNDPKIEDEFIKKYLRFVDNPDLLEDGLGVFNALGT